MNNSRTKIAKELQNFRASQGLSTYAAAKQANIRLEVLQAIESANNYTIDSLLKYLDTFDLSLSIQNESALSSEE